MRLRIKLELRCVFRARSFIFGFLFLFLAAGACVGQIASLNASSSGPVLRRLEGHIPNAVTGLHPVGFLPPSQHLNLAITLPVPNPEKLEQFLRDLYDPGSSNYRHYLTPAQFTEAFGPNESDYAAVMAFARNNHLMITATHPNRLVLDVNATVSEIEQAFHLRLLLFNHPIENRIFFAPDTEPLVEQGLPIQHISGLDNYWLPHPNWTPVPLAEVAGPKPRSGSGPNGTYRGSDFRAAYVPGTDLTGTGQSVGLLEFDGYYANDITTYENLIGLTGNVPQLVNVAIDGGVPNPGTGNGEVSLDIEMVVSLAPGVSKIYVYQAPNPSPWVDLLSRMANDNLARQFSSSWGGGGPDAASEAIFQQMAAQGQSFFNASGDHDAYTGAIPFPSDSPHIVQVGGTSLTTVSGAAYSSETVWNSGRGLGSSGGISTYYSIPTWQQNVSMANNQGSTTMRNVPDVALIADNVFETYNNGSQAAVVGTSCATPLWAAFTALANQRATQAGLPPLGFLNPALYAIGEGPAYASCFHDITTGNNTWTRSRNQFFAASGYDLCTGWGTPNGTNLINALVPVPVSVVAAFSASPTVGPAPLTVTFTDTSSGNIDQREWDFGNGVTTNTSVTSFEFTYASPGTNTVSLTVSGAGGTNTLTQAAYIVVTNGVITANSNAPTITSQPQNVALLAGSDATFNVQASGATPLSYQWRFNSTDIPAATNASYTRFNVQPAYAGPYDVVVSNGYGSATSSVAKLSVVSRPLLIHPNMSSNGIFSFTITGNAGFNYAIEATTNFTDWSVLGTLTNPFGQILFADTNSLASRFLAFRARLLP
jgi:subtilase family serine protease